MKDDYFCDTASGSFVGFFKLNNPLWDGADCCPDSSCCTFNSPPWFYNTDDVEMRVCSDQARGDEDIGIKAIEMYVQ